MEVQKSASEGNDFEIMSGVLDTFSRCGLTIGEAREEISRLLNHPLSEIDSKSEWLSLPLSVYLAKLQNGELGIEKSASAKNKEALFLQALVNIEKALNDDHDHED